MAKKRSRPGASAQGAQAAVLGFAEELGRILGTTERKANEWLQQREAIAQQLTQIRDTAGKYLAQLTGGGASVAAAVRRGRRGRPPGSKNKQASADGRSRQQRRTQMSAAQRKAVSARMKKYWAERRKAST
jgi:hypothetical protein